MTAEEAARRLREKHPITAEQVHRVAALLLTVKSGPGGTMSRTTREELDRQLRRAYSPDRISGTGAGRSELRLYGHGSHQDQKRYREAVAVMVEDDGA